MPLRYPALLLATLLLVRLAAAETDADRLDDSTWSEIKTPADWDSQGHRGVKGAKSRA